MNVKLAQPGNYVVAVSGGVDSMVLLHLLHQNLRRDQCLIVAHLDHGVRTDSALDRELVESVASKLGHEFVYKEAKLGPKASEAAAREARYLFFNDVVRQQNAVAVITAHHQDDLIETAIINLIRGTGRKGPAALSNRSNLLRPLLKYTKAELIKYALANQLNWREDSTNADTKYLRNYIRLNIMTKLNPAAKEQLLTIINRLDAINSEVDRLLADLLNKQSPAKLERALISDWPLSFAKEVLAGWLRQNGVTGFDRRSIERLVVQSKVSPPGQRYPVHNGQELSVQPDFLALEPIER